MNKIVIIKDDKQLEVIITDKQLEKLVDTLYPSSTARKDAKGYITLVNFIYNGR